MTSPETILTFAEGVDAELFAVEPGLLAVGLRQEFLGCLRARPAGGFDVLPRTGGMARARHYGLALAFTRRDGVRKLVQLKHREE